MGFAEQLQATASPLEESRSLAYYLWGKKEEERSEQLIYNNSKT